ncbi:hypothetical protein Sjap_017572 [Stephania japonica]|uniref:Uncharacterized protein n=1 Tax=Stephania japonica TaxID=461633 RepID=A0AAP0I6F4_9MAGN
MREERTEDAKERKGGEEGENATVSSRDRGVEESSRLWTDVGKVEEFGKSHKSVKLRKAQDR